MSATKLNLGCGGNLVPGFCNVDKYGEPDLKWDLEAFPWPWADGTIEEILLVHALEHLGQQTEQFLSIMKELYRVCKNDAVIKIIVPHPRHDNFIGDPTHVRPITPDVLSLFSKKNNLLWQKNGMSSTPLALYHNVDFEITALLSSLDEPYNTLYREGKIPLERLQDMERTLNNIVREIEITLKVVK